MYVLKQVQVPVLPPVDLDTCTARTCKAYIKGVCCLKVHQFLFYSIL